MNNYSNKNIYGNGGFRSSISSKDSSNYTYNANQQRIEYHNIMKVHEGDNFYVNIKAPKTENSSESKKV